MWGKQINSPDEFIPALMKHLNKKDLQLLEFQLTILENMKLTKHLGKVSAII